MSKINDTKKKNNILYVKINGTTKPIRISKTCMNKQEYDNYTRIGKLESIGYLLERVSEDVLGRSLAIVKQEIEVTNKEKSGLSTYAIILVHPSGRMTMVRQGDDFEDILRRYNIMLANLVCLMSTFDSLL